MSTLTPLSFGQIVTIFGGVGACVAFAWKAGISIVDRLEKSKQKQIDYSHNKAKDLEKQKLELQKELEAQKQRHVHKLIEAIRSEMTKLADKVDELAIAFGRVDEKLNFNAKLAEANLKKIQGFVDSTNKRFETIEKEFTLYRSEIKEISKDLLLIKSVAIKVRDKQGKNSGT